MKVCSAVAAACQPDRCEDSDRGDIKTVERKKRRESERASDFIVPKKSIESINTIQVVKGEEREIRYTLVTFK